MTLTPSERVKRSNQKKKDRGLILTTVWVPDTDEHKAKLRKYADKLIKDFEQ